MISTKTAYNLAIAGQHGRHWYKTARVEIAAVCKRNGWDMSTFVGILAVTSPRVAVRRNIRIAYKYMLGDDWTDGTIKSVRVGVAHFERTREIRGPKTSAFYRCLMGCEDSICLDSWMAYAFDVDKAKVNQVGIGGRIKRRIRRVAAVTGWTNAEVQAAIWTGIMARSGRNDQPFCIDEIDREFLPI